MCFNLKLVIISLVSRKFDSQNFFASDFMLVAAKLQNMFLRDIDEFEEFDNFTDFCNFGDYGDFCEFGSFGNFG